MIRVIVERKRWMRGTGNGKLLGQNGKMCCIGFLARRLGCKSRDIRMKGTLDEVNAEATSTFDRAYKWVLNTAYEINDDTAILDPTREKELKKTGREMGIQFVFKG